MSGSYTWTLGSSPPGITPSTVRRVSAPKSPTDLSPVTGDVRGTLDAIDCDSLNINYLPIVNVLRNDGGTVDLFAVGSPSISPDATRITVWLAGGSVGFEYLVSITFQSIDGQELTRSFIIPVAIR